MEPRYIEDFGQAQNGFWDDAFATAMRAHLGETQANREGPTILIGKSAMAYRLSKPLDTFGVHLKGLRPDVALEFPNSHGVICHFPNTVHGPGTYQGPDQYAGYGGRLRITDLTLVGKTQAQEKFHALQTEWVVEAFNLTIKNWSGDGYRAVNDLRSSTKHSGSNGSSTYHLSVVNCLGAGIRHQGGDSNACLHLQPNIQQCGNGIIDQSFLGNTYIAAHIDTITDPEGYAIYSDNPNSRNRFIAPYVEGYSRVSVAPPAVVISAMGGGLDDITPHIAANTRAMLLQGQVEFSPRKPWRGEVQELKFWPRNEMDDEKGTVTAFSLSAGNWPLRLKRVAEKQGGTSFVLDHANIRSRRSLEIMLDGAKTQNGHGIAPGTIGFPIGYTIGRERALVTRATSSSQLNPDSYELGSQIWNSNPRVGSYVGWVLGTDPQGNRAWLPFGKVE